MTPRTFRVLLLLVAAPALALACRRRLTYAPPSPRIDGVRFAAQAAVVSPGDSLLEVRVRAVNTARAVRMLEWGNCSMDVRVSSVGGTPARSWEYVAWANARRPPLVCLLYLASRDLAPGDSIAPGDYFRRLPVRVILGDSLPPGRYRVTARVGANGRSSGDVAGGEVELRAPPT